MKTNNYVIQIFNDYLTDKYDYFRGLLLSKIPNVDEADEILNFTIDYFYTKYSKEKLEALINQKPNGAALDSYIIKSLYLNYSSPSAPFQQSNRKYKDYTHFDYPFSEVEDVIDDSIMYEDDEVDYISDLIIKIVHTEYVKSKFSSLHHWEYARKILHLHIVEGISYVDIEKKTQISTNTLRYNFRKLRKLIYDVITNENLLLSVLPKDDVKNIYSNVNEKINKHFMDYFKILEGFNNNLHHLNSNILKKAASQKIRKLNEGVERDLICILIDMLDHLQRCKGVVNDKVLAEERIRLVHEVMGQTPYGKSSCGSCMDMITRYLHNILHKNAELIKEYTNK